MDVRYLAGPDALLAAAGPALEADEARHGLVLGIARRLCGELHYYGPEDPWFCVVGEAGALQAVALRTPPHKVLLAQLAGDPQECARALACVLQGRGSAVPGAVGNQALADAFSAEWCRAAGVTVRERMAQRVYRLTRVRPLPLASGRLRRAEPADADLVTRWGHAFHADVFAEASPAEPLTDLGPRIGRQEVSLWEDGAPVSLAAYGRPTGSGVSITTVYTPPEVRGRGYATACVAALCGQLLTAGYRFCMLYADLANPTANALYQRIGFEVVGDSADYVFSQ
ncbi:MAG: GNAT family N-acetyltransferase [Candidatus Latescibacterota bacterium]